MTLATDRSIIKLNSSRLHYKKNALGYRLKVPFGTGFLNWYPESGTKGSSLWYRVKQPVPMAKIFTQNILWLGFKPETSSLARCYFTISPTQQF